MDLTELRKQIDEVDSGLIRLFQRRMEISAEIALYKAKSGLAVHDPAREREKLEDMLSKTDEPFKAYGEVLYPMLFELSRAYQQTLIDPDRGAGNTQIDR
jgi:monofunctional chorismate mutase